MWRFWLKKGISLCHFWNSIEHVLLELLKNSRGFFLIFFLSGRRENPCILYRWDGQNSVYIANISNNWKSKKYFETIFFLLIHISVFIPPSPSIPLSFPFLPPLTSSSLPSPFLPHLPHVEFPRARDQTCTTAATQVTKMIMLGPQSHVPQENSSSSILLRYYFNIFSDKVDQITWYGKYGHKLTAALSTKRWNLFSFWFALTNREI